jgi:hypothetical protein
MEKFLYVFIHLALPLLLLAEFILRRSKSKFGLLAKSSLYIAIFYFLYSWGQWPLIGSYYLRYLMITFILFVFLLSFKRYQKVKMSKPLGVRNIIMLVSTVFLLFLFLIINYNVFRGKRYSDKGVALEFPLKNGTYYVASGGSNKLINNHMRGYPNAQEFALDINKLGKYRSASKAFLSSVNTDHYIFSDTIYCPCNGRIIEIKNNVKDNEYGSMNVTSGNGTGNFVSINCEEDIFVFIPHLKQFSVLVSKGMIVKKGTPLALVGISGFSQEPHLHIQAAKYDLDSSLVGIPIFFNGSGLFRNDIYKN